jgi:magnesium transporter
MFTRYDFVEGKIVQSVDPKAKMLVCSKPGRTELAELEEGYGISPHRLNSALDPDELGRMEKAKNHWSFIVKNPCNFTSEDQLLFTVSSMGLFLFKDRLIVVTPEEFDLSDYRQVRDVKNVRDAFLALIYGSTMHFISHIKVITMLSDSLEKRINTSMENHYLLNMFTLEKSLVFFVNGIGSNQVVIESIKENAGRMRFSASQLETLKEIIIENRQSEPSFSCRSTCWRAWAECQNSPAGHRKYHGGCPFPASSRF